MDVYSDSISPIVRHGAVQRSYSRLPLLLQGSNVSRPKGHVDRPTFTEVRGHCLLANQSSRHDGKQRTLVSLTGVVSTQFPSWEIRLRDPSSPCFITVTPVVFELAELREERRSSESFNRRSLESQPGNLLQQFFVPSRTKFNCNRSDLIDTR